MICPKCGEDNAATFRFCGMCGAVLEAKPNPDKLEPQKRAVLPSPPALTRDAPSHGSSPTVNQRIKTAWEMSASIGQESQGGRDGTPGRLVPPTRGQSMPTADRRGDPPSTTPSTTNRPTDAGSVPSALPSTASDDPPRAPSAGVELWPDPEPAQRGMGRLVVLFSVFVAISVAGWWTYTTYFRGTQATTKSEYIRSSDSSATKSADESNTSDNVAEGPAPSPAGSSAADSAPPPAVGGERRPEVRAPRRSTKKSNPAAGPSSKRAAAQSSQTDPQKKTTRPRRAKASLPYASRVDRSNEVDLRKGESYLYGRGVKENCAEAAKYLKLASSKGSAHAQSNLGTMYATGHCVPRDLPTSYAWFARALRGDPNNKTLETDLNAIWGQMSPLERQMATKTKE